MTYIPYTPSPSGRHHFEDLVRISASSGFLYIWSHEFGHLSLTRLDRPVGLMAHIVSCMLDSDSEDFILCLNNYIAKEVSPQSSNESVRHSGPQDPSQKPVNAYTFMQTAARSSFAVRGETVYLEDVPPRKKISAVLQGHAVDSL